MVLAEMTEEECYAMLARTSIARLACTRDNQPYIVPIHIDFEDRFLYGFSTVGQKIDWMRQNPLVCLEVDQLTTQTDWSSVVVLGAYEELPLEPGSEESRAVAERLFQRHAMWWEPATVKLPSGERRPPVVFRIRINHVSGRRALPDNVASAAPAS